MKQYFEIVDVMAREILDSRGNPTVEVEVEGTRDLQTLFDRDLGVGDGAAGADTLTHVAVDAGLRVEDDASAVVRRRLTGDEGVHVAARLAEELGYGFSDKREIHYICPLFSLSIWVARARPSMMASGLGAQPAISTSTWTYLLSGPQTE